MARIIDDVTKIKINVLYSEYKNYSKVARELGVSASTVKKYVISGFDLSAQDNERKVLFEDLEKFNPNELISVESFGKICTYTQDEKDAILELQKELIL